MAETQRCIIDGEDVFYLIRRGLEEYPEAGKIEGKTIELMKIRLDNSSVGIVRNSNGTYTLLILTNEAEEINKAEKTLEKLTGLHPLNFMR